MSHSNRIANGWPRFGSVLLRRVVFHYTPKHASWLNMAEIGVGIGDGLVLDLEIDDAAFGALDGDNAGLLVDVDHVSDEMGFLDRHGARLLAQRGTCSAFAFFSFANPRAFFQAQCQHLIVFDDNASASALTEPPMIIAGTDLAAGAASAAKNGRFDQSGSDEGGEEDFVHLRISVWLRKA